MRAIGLQKLLTFWCDSVSKLAIYRQKTAMGHPPSSETTGRIEKNEGGAKMVRTSSIFGKGGDLFNRCQRNLTRRKGLKVSLNLPNLVLLR